MLARRVAVTCAVGCALASAARADDWRGTVTVGNDAFDSVLSQTDDDGFTSDLGVALYDVHGALALGGSLLHRMITSRDSPLRCDLGEVFARAAWMPRPHVQLELRLGPAFAGNLGGYWLQSRWHHVTGDGPRDPRMLQNEYAGGLRAGGEGGLRAMTGWGGPVRAYGSLDVQLAAGGTGVTFAEAMIGGALTRHRYSYALGLHVELAAGIYHVDDMRLAIPGGYRRGGQLDARIGVHAAFGRYRFAFDYHTNETSSGEPFGIFSVERR